MQTRTAREHAATEAYRAQVAAVALRQLRCGYCHKRECPRRGA